MEIKCDYCGKVKKRKPSEVNDTYNFCSRDCRGSFLKTQNLDEKIINKFVKSTWTNMNIRCGKYTHLQTKSKCKSYNEVKITFTRDEYKEWCLNNKDTIFKLDRPSLDRINSDGDYSLDNIRVIELEQNIKQKRDGHKFINSKEKRGVRELKSGYSARISIKGKEVYLGKFGTKEEAYIAFFNKYVEVYGKEPW